MKPFSAKNMPKMPRLSRKKRLRQIERVKNSKPRFYEYAEKANYDINDIATDEEAITSQCDCLIHSGGRQPAQIKGYMKHWADWEEV